jgi:hypothetical protein
MIVPEYRFRTLPEYQAASESERVPSRPEQCPGCHATKGIWRHTPYQRFVLERGNRVSVTIHRFFCSKCAGAISCLYAFLVPYRRFSLEVMSVAAESYAETGDTYLELAEEISMQRGWMEESGKLIAEQIFRWVKVLTDKANTLTTQLQRYFIQRGTGEWLLVSGGHCPSAYRAKSAEKAKNLNIFAHFLDLGRLHSRSEENLAKLSLLFLKETETKSWLLSQHYLQCALF